jgi:hypothetical protein
MPIHRDEHHLAFHHRFGSRIGRRLACRVGFDGLLKRGVDRRYRRLFVTAPSASFRATAAIALSESIDAVAGGALYCVAGGGPSGCPSGACGTLPPVSLALPSWIDSRLAARTQPDGHLRQSRTEPQATPERSAFIAALSGAACRKSIIDIRKRPTIDIEGILQSADISQHRTPRAARGPRLSGGSRQNQGPD